MSDKPLNKRERNFIRPAVCFGWEIHQDGWTKNALWDGDKLCPVRIGAVAESLIERGYLDKIPMGYGGYRLRATDKARMLHCNHCSHGKTLDEDGRENGTCTHCDGRGMIQERGRNCVSVTRLNSISEGKREVQAAQMPVEDISPLTENVSLEHARIVMKDIAPPFNRYPSEDLAVLLSTMNKTLEAVRKHVGKAQPVTVKLSLAVSNGAQGYREKIIRELAEQGVTVEDRD